MSLSYNLYKDLNGTISIVLIENDLTFKVIKKLKFNNKCGRVW